MNGFLLDTNIPSEMTKPFPQKSVVQWLEEAVDDQLYFQRGFSRRDFEGDCDAAGKQAQEPTSAVAH